MCVCVWGGGGYNDGSRSLMVKQIENISSVLDLKATLFCGVTEH